MRETNRWRIVTLHRLARCHGHRMRHFHGWGRQIGDRRHLVQYLLEREIFAAQDISLAGFPTLHGRNMRSRHLIDIHQIQSCVDIGWELAVEKIDDDLPCRRRLNVICADRRSRI